MNTKVSTTLVTPQPRKQRVEVLQQLFKHVREEAAALVELSDAKSKPQLRAELSMHAHMLQKTIDSIQRACP